MILVGEPSKRNRKRKKEVWMVIEDLSIPDIVISQSDGSHIKQPHNDALVISAYVKNYLVKRMLVDDGSAVNVLTWDTFRKMEGSPGDLKNTINPTTSFYGGTIQPMGSIKLEVEFGNRNIKESVMIKTLFNVVDTRLAYNGVIV